MEKKKEAVIKEGQIRLGGVRTSPPQIPPEPLPPNQIPKQEQKTTEESARIDELESKVRHLEIQLQAADEGLLRCSSSSSHWQGLHQECKEWMDRALKAEKKLKAFSELTHDLYWELYDPALIPDDSLLQEAFDALKAEGLIVEE